MSETASTFRLPLGDPAPSFVLDDPSGAPFSLEEIMGEKGILVVFAAAAAAASIVSVKVDKSKSKFGANFGIHR